MSDDTDDANSIAKKYGAPALRKVFDSADSPPPPKQAGRAGRRHRAGRSGAGVQDAVALAFAKQHSNTFRYVAPWGRWLKYTNAYWTFEETLAAFDEARKLCRDARDADASTVAAVVKLASSDRALVATTDQWDVDPMLLGTPGGTIDLRNGQLREAVQSDYITKVTAVAPAGDCPTWCRFLDRVTDGDAELQQFLQRVCGYALTGSTKEDALFFCHGGGQNGKTVFLKTVASILNDYHKTASMETFTVSKVERHPTDLANLRGARLVTAVETEEGKRWDEAKIKALTGGDRISARFMRQDFFEYVPQFKLLMAGNHRPGLRTVDVAIRRRMNLIPFTVQIPEKDRDRELITKLRAEWPGILKWMVGGCLEWQRIGLSPPAIVNDATNAYLDAEDSVQTWLVECCDTLPMLDEEAAALWASWKGWAERTGEIARSQKWLSNQLQGKGFGRAKIAGQWCYRGLKLKAAS